MTPTEFDADGVEVPFTLILQIKQVNNGVQLTSLSNDPDGVDVVDEVVPTLTTVKIYSNNDDTLLQRGETK